MSWRSRIGDEECHPIVAASIIIGVLVAAALMWIGLYQIWTWLG